MEILGIKKYILEDEKVAIKQQCNENIGDKNVRDEKQG